MKKKVKKQRPRSRGSKIEKKQSKSNSIRTYQNDEDNFREDRREFRRNNYFKSSALEGDFFRSNVGDHNH